MATKIMIADDSPIIRSVLRGLLRRNPEWELCGEVDNGQAAVAKASELRPDVIILDLEMPLMDGLSAARVILKALPSTPIILYTMHYTPDLEPEAKKSGVRKVLSKSDAANLVAVIQEITAAKSVSKLESSSAKKKRLPPV